MKCGCSIYFSSSRQMHPRRLIRACIVRTKKLCTLGYTKCTQWRFWSDCPNAQDDLITKTRLYSFDPLKSHFYTVKLGFTGVYIIFLISAQIHDFGYSLEPPRRGGSNEYSQSMFWAEMLNYLNFSSENFHFLVVKFSMYLNKRVFVMWIFDEVRFLSLQFIYRIRPNYRTVRLGFSKLLENW